MSKVITIDDVDVSKCYNYNKETGTCRTGYRVDEIPYCECFTCEFKRWKQAEQKADNYKQALEEIRKISKGLAQTRIPFCQIEEQIQTIIKEVLND